MIIIILGFGLMMTLAELNQYNLKEKTIMENVKNKAQTVAMITANSPLLDCNLNNTSLAYSLNTTKINALTTTLTGKQIKEKLGLQDYNAQIVLKGTPDKTIITEPVDTKNIYAIDINVLICDQTTTADDLLDCAKTSGTCNPAKVDKRVLTIKVGK
jgi:hypothetical protein